MSREILIYCDESDASGAHFGHFYGGALVESTHLAEVVDRLTRRKAELNFMGEVKWQKITQTYAEKYLALLDTLFDLLGEHKLKLRVMFTQNAFRPQEAIRRQEDEAFFKLYYQFVKHAFGLGHAGRADSETKVRLLFDSLPDTAERCAAFKGYVLGLNQSRAFRSARIRIQDDQIAEVDSHDHVILQCLDIVLGAMPFRLNDKHREKPAGSRVRGKRTIAKERVYKHILMRIRHLHPNFNIGISTGTPNGLDDRWAMPYRHWRFVPAEAEYRPELTKRGHP
ncbi:MAG: DUF3800 domain-containing protein [Panacagrimonas sp.]